VSKRKHQIKANLEWGSKARKDEDRLRGFNNSDRRAAIAEQVADLTDAQRALARDNMARFRAKFGIKDGS
jgi:hypothetical protein